MKISEKFARVQKVSVGTAGITRKLIRKELYEHLRLAQRCSTNSPPCLRAEDCFRLGVRSLNLELAGLGAIFCSRLPFFCLRLAFSCARLSIFSRVRSSRSLYDEERISSSSLLYLLYLSVWYRSWYEGCGVSSSPLSLYRRIAKIPIAISPKSRDSSTRSIIISSMSNAKA